MQSPWRSVVFWLALLAYSATFLKHPRLPALGMAPPTVGCSLPHQSLIKKVPYRLAQQQSDADIFFSDTPFPDNSTLP